MRGLYCSHLQLLLVCRSVGQIETTWSQAHLNTQLGPWNQSPREDLNCAQCGIAPTRGSGQDCQSINQSLIDWFMYPLAYCLHFGVLSTGESCIPEPPGGGNDSKSSFVNMQMTVQNIQPSWSHWVRLPKRFHYPTGRFHCSQRSGLLDLCTNHSLNIKNAMF